MRKTECVDTAIQGGIGYLESRLENGLWIEDFGVRHGPSDCWSTAYVGRLVREAGFDFTNQSLGPLLELQKTNGGWAYNENVPPDADTTINILVYLNRLPQDSYNRGLKFVLDHQNESGGIFAWTIEEVEKMGYQGIGWSIPHTCTTALSLRVLEGERRERAIRHLRSRRLPDGSWASYWWKDGGLYSILECSRVFGIDEGMRNYIIGVEPTTTFGLGLKIQGLLEIGVESSQEVKRLLKKQNIDGSWGSSAVTKIPYPNVIDETDDDVRVVSDNNRTFSTAAAVLALSKVRHLFLGI